MEKVARKQYGHIYGQMIFYKGFKKLQCTNSSFFFNRGCSENWISTYKRMKLSSYVIHIINSTWMRDEIVRTEIIKVLEEDIGKMFCDSGIRSDLLDMKQSYK